MRILNHPQVNHLLSITPLKFTERDKYLTGSDFPAALNRGYKTSKNQNTRTNLLNKKLNLINPWINHKYVEYGTKNEPLALAAYMYWAEKTRDAKLYHIGTMTHKMVHGEKSKYDYIAGTPDAVTSDGILVEAKCPFWSKSTGIGRKDFLKTIAPYYVDQVQGYMYILGLEVCHFIQYLHKTETKPAQLNIIIINKDENWEQKNVPLLEEFYNEWQKKIEIEKRDFDIFVDKLIEEASDEIQKKIKTELI